MGKKLIEMINKGRLISPCIQDGEPRRHSQRVLGIELGLLSGRRGADSAARTACITSPKGLC